MQLFIESNCNTKIQVLYSLKLQIVFIFKNLIQIVAVKVIKKDLFKMT